MYRSSWRIWMVMVLLAFSLGACGDDEGGETSVGTDTVDPSDAGDATDGDTSQPDVSGDDVASDPDVPAPVDADAGLDATDDAEADVAADAGPDAPFFDPDVPLPDGGEAPEETGEVLIFGIDPPTGPREGGTFVVIFGEGFTPDAEVLLGGRRLEGVDVVDGGTIVGFTPEGSPGPVDVKVVSRRGQGMLPSAFRYIEALRITSVEPAEAPERGGVAVTIRGGGFTSDARVSFGGERLLDARVVDATRIEGIAPPGLPGPADVRVTTALSSERAQGLFAYYAEPRIDTVSPGAGPTSGGTTVTLTGANFEEGATVRWDGAPVSATRISATELRVVTPPGMAGAVDVSVDVPGRGLSVAGSAFVYVPTNAPVGVPLAVVPGSGDVAGGDLVWIAGRDLDTADAIRFGAEPVDAFERSTPWGVEVLTPPASAPGAVDVHVDTESATETLTDGFLYLERPTVLAVEPDRGSVDGGDEVLVRGTGLTADARVRFGLLAAEVVSASAEGLRVRTPASSAGTVAVHVEMEGVPVTLDDAFTFEGELELLGLVPSRGAIAGNTWVVLRGDNFAEGAQVRFGESAGTDVVRLDASSLAVRTPPGTPGVVDVTVTQGGVDVVSPVRFTYYDPWRDVGGWWGGSIDGSVNVTVADIETGNRIEGAFVTLAIRSGQRQFEGYTNAAGQVTLSGPGLAGIQSVSASAVTYSSATVTNVDAENVILFLTLLESDGEGPPPEPVILPTIEGSLTGLDKITVPGPDEVLVGIIRTSTPVAGGRNPDGTGYTEVRYAGNQASFPYTMSSRLGEVAVVAICGALNQRTGDFRPILLGLERGLNTRPEQTYTVDIACDIPMGDTMSFKFLSSPVGAPGITGNTAVPFIDLGGEGGFDLLQAAEGRDDVLSLSRVVSLEHPSLAGASYFVIGEASGPDGLPFSVAFERNIRTHRDVVELGPMLPPAELRYPALPARTLIERRFEWTLPTAARPDFYYAYITDVAQEAVFWEVWVPGDENSFNLPFFPPGEETADIPAGPLVLIVMSIDAYTFNYDEFSFNDFGQNNWRSYSANGWLITNPG